jgi:hypothetical protein
MDHFSQFKLRFNKAYSKSEHEMRYNIFKANLDMIMKHNLEGRHSWTMAVNEFADLTEDEFKAQRTGFIPTDTDLSIPRVSLNMDGLISVPDSIDWRD